MRPDLVVEVRRDILAETDGPMLQHGLQEIAGNTLLVPRSEKLKPRVDFLEARYELFRKMGQRRDPQLSRRGPLGAQMA